MSRPALTIKALGERMARPSRSLQNRIQAHRARLGNRPKVVEALPEPVLFGDADLGLAMVGGTWRSHGHAISLGSGTIWDAELLDDRLEDERQSCLWLDDLGALGNRAARQLAQRWVLDWVRRYGFGSGPGWRPDLAGRRAKRWTAHAQLLTRGLERADLDRFWFGLAAQQRYLQKTWPQAPEGLARLRALAGLVWSGVVLPHVGHGEAMSELGLAAEALIDAKGEVASRVPEDLAEALILLIWTARILENSGQHADPAHLAAIVRGVPVLRPLRMGDGSLACFQGGGPGAADRIDQALAELRIGVQAKPRLAMGYARLGGARIAVVIDGAAPPAAVPTRAHAGTLAFEMSIGRQPVMVNAGPGHGFGRERALECRRTAAHNTVEINGVSSARLEADDLAARTFGARLSDGPTLVSVRQAQDASGEWLLATHDGYATSQGVLHERRLFVDAHGGELRGEDILTVPDARGRALFDRAADEGYLPFAARFLLHPDVAAEFDRVRQIIFATLPSGEVWAFRASGGRLALEEARIFDPARTHPVPTAQVVVHGGVVEYLGQIIWSFGRVAEARAASDAPR